MSDADGPMTTAKPSFAPGLRVLVTLFVVVIAAALGWQAWRAYMGAPWTRDGRVRAYVGRIASQVAGEIVQLPVKDNQFVRKGDLLMLIDPTDYAIAVRRAQAAAAQAKATADNAHAEMARRQKLDADAVTPEELQTYTTQAESAEAAYQSTLAALDQARANLKRTRIVAPTDGYVTNLTARLGDFANVGDRLIALVDAGSFWIDAYFEETTLPRIHEGDAATIKLMGHSTLLRGVVAGIARGIDVPNATADSSGLASVNPIFTFVRLAQRIPVRTKLDPLPTGLVAGMTASVQIEPGSSATAPLADTTPSPPAGRSGADAGAAPPPLAQPQQTAVPPPAPALQTPPLAGPSGDSAAPALPPPPDETARKLVDSENLTPSEYLGKTYNLFGNESETPLSHTPDTLRRRAHERWRYDR
jgi:multidrug resistance efflux pump